jgi:hypothetical protein
MALRIAAKSALRANTTRSFSAAASGLDRAQTEENYNAVLQKFAEIRACAVLRTATSEACPKAMTAAIDGGFKICEFTLTTPDCLDHLSDFRKKYDGDVMIGWYVFFLILTYFLCRTVICFFDLQVYCIMIRMSHYDGVGKLLTTVVFFKSKR